MSKKIEVFRETGRGFVSEFANGLETLLTFSDRDARVDEVRQCIKGGSRFGTNYFVTVLLMVG